MTAETVAYASSAVFFILEWLKPLLAGIGMNNIGHPQLYPWIMRSLAFLVAVPVLVAVAGVENRPVPGGVELIGAALTIAAGNAVIQAVQSRIEGESKSRV